MKKYYYISSPSCMLRNMKEKMLAEYLMKFRNTLIEFGKDYSAEILLADIRERVNEINASSKRSGDIYVRMDEGMRNDGLAFSFFRKNHSGEVFAMMILKPVRRWVAGSSSNGKSDAE